MQNSNEGAIVAKIKAIYGKKIQKNQLIELSSCKDVSSIASYLKSKTSYSKILEQIDENTIRRGQLENLIKQQNFNNYEKIFHYLSKNNKTIFKLAIDEFEILEILRIILLLKANNMKEYITSLPAYLISKCKINLIRLAKVKTFEELLNSVKRTRYYKILAGVGPKDETQEIDYNACEHALFTQFFEEMFTTIEKNVKKNEQSSLKKLIKQQIDYLNICRIYRSRLIFNENRQKIVKKIIPFHGILNEQKINSLIESKTSEEFGSKFDSFFHASKHYKNILNFFNGENCYIENFTDKLSYRIYKRLIHISNSFSIVFFSFHKLAQIELSNLIYAIEGVRYGVESKEIQNLFVF